MRKYLPTYADLVDRMSICQLKQIFIPENADAYAKEILDIQHDLDEILKEKKVTINAKIVWASQLIMLGNRYIWENESKVRNGESQDLSLLICTHSINGIRNTAKNIISKELGERIDLKIDCLAANLPKELGYWNVFKDYVNE